MKAASMKKLILIGAVLFAGFSVTGCKKKVESSRVAYIIGDDDMNIIDSGSETYKNYKEVIDSSVLIVTGTSSGTSQFCSGVLVNVEGNIRVLSNHHCFAVKDESGLATPTLLDTACSKTSVYFNNYRLHKRYYLLIRSRLL